MGSGHVEIAEAMVRDFEAGDYVGALRWLSPSARIWHSTDNQWQSVDEVMASMTDAGLVDGGPPFTDTRITETASGYVVQAALQLPEGPTFHIVQVAKVEDGMVSSVEEYVAAEAPPIP